MGNFFDLLVAFLELVKAVAKLPTDWNSEEQVETWLAGQNSPMAKVVVLLVPDQAADRRIPSHQAVPAIGLPIHLVRGSDVDWKQIIDWVAGMLIAFFPQHADLIRRIAEVAKLVIDWFLDHRPELETDEAVRLWLAREAG